MRGDEMRIFDNYGRSNGKTMELACQIAEAIKGKGTVVVIPIEELLEYKNNSIREFAIWLIERIHRNSLQRVLSETKNFDIMGIDNILSIYEKECKNG